MSNMIVLKGMKYRIYVTPEQAQFLGRISGCVRLVYNLGLEQRSMFGRAGRPFYYKGQNLELTDLKEEAEFLREVPSQCLQAGLKDLETAFDRFFDGISGYPTPRRKGLNDGFRFPDPKQFYVETIDDDDKYVLLHLPKLGMRPTDHGPLRLRLHRPLKGKIRSVTLNHQAGIWHASFLCEVEIADPVTPTGEAVGVDLGVAVPIMLSDGRMPHVPLPSTRNRRRERCLRKAISRRKRGSHNRRRAVRALGRHKAKEARRRTDALHKATTNLAKNHRQVVIEDLRIANMTASAAGTAAEPGRNVRQKAGLNRAILSVGWGSVKVMLDYKCRWHGSELITVPPGGTSQTCSVCRHRDAKSRVSRDQFRCTSCGHAGHAD